MPTPSITVVAPTYRRPDRAARLVRALEAQTLATNQFDVVLVDDCSGPDALDELQSAIGATSLHLRILQTPANGGPAVARNLGWRTSGSNLFAFVDDDCVPDAAWLAAGLTILDGPDRPGVVQGCTQVPVGVDVATLPRWSLWREIAEPGPFFEGCNIFYRRDALEAAGGFDEQIAWWGEDTALGWRVVEAGWATGWAGDATVVHDVEQRGFRWHVRQGWNERNVITLAARHPGYRAGAFWRPWAFRRNDALFALGLAGVALGPWQPLALTAALPYLWKARPSVRQPQFLQAGAEIVAVDAARFVGHVAGALRNRILVV